MKNTKTVANTTTTLKKTAFKLKTQVRAGDAGGRYIALALSKDEGGRH